MVPFPFRTDSLAAVFPLMLIACLLAAGCSGPSGGISGHLLGGENATVSISSFGNNGFKTIDTVQADGTGHFVIPANALSGLALDVYKVNVGEGHFFMIGDSLSSLQVTGSTSPRPDRPDHRPRSLKATCLDRGVYGSSLPRSRAPAATP